MSDRDNLIAALRCQRQIDADGSEVGVSRQAVDMAIDELIDLERRKERVRGLELQHGKELNGKRVQLLERAPLKPVTGKKYKPNGCTCGLPGICASRIVNIGLEPEMKLPKDFWKWVLVYLVIAFFAAVKLFGHTPDLLEALTRR